MFTGIVTARGHIRAIEGDGDDRLRVTIDAPFTDLESGESVAVNGACLTVAAVTEGGFMVDVIGTTRSRTTVGDWSAGRVVNLERSLGVGDRFGGHFVQGHIDGVGEVLRVCEEADALVLDFRVPHAVFRVSVAHGSIAVDGVSLTINATAEPNVVQVALIPYTRTHTTLGRLAAGDRVHIEGDLIGKHVARLLETRGA